MEVGGTRSSSSFEVSRLEPMDPPPPAGTNFGEGLPPKSEQQQQHGSSRLEETSVVLRRSNAGPDADHSLCVAATSNGLPWK